MKVIGFLYAIGSTEYISDKFQKRDIVVETDEKYPQWLTIQVVNDQCDDIDRFQLGDHLEIDINLRGRKYISKKDGSECYFNSIQAWKMSIYSTRGRAHASMQDLSAPVQSVSTPAQSLSALAGVENAENDLPF